MLFVLLWISQVTSHVWSQELPPPRDVHVDSLVRWMPAPEYSNPTYRVQYRRHNGGGWRDVPTCVWTELTSCDVTLIKTKHGCVRLQVQAEEHGMTSKPVEACSKQGDLCSPAVLLTPRAGPGFLTVNLSRNHSLVLEHGDHIKHNVCWEGEAGKKCQQTLSSWDIKNVKEGLTYCVTVQFLYYLSVHGPPSCPQCETIPESSDTKQEKITSKVTAAAVVVVIIVLLVPAIAYILLYQHERIKRWMRPCEIPEPLPVHCQPVCGQREERCDLISSVSIEEESHQRA